jgi:hypothetical protein
LVTLRFVSIWVIVTLAPGTTAPLGSVTVPSIDPVKDCAYTCTQANSTASATPILMNKNLDWFFS